ncbi:hypothetical protein [Pseudobacteriovorax antillogorgiicola]|uniref:Uncharacterized protein n=1 Tax=Pseudobacteriovorax antillogorgiicola TaxID=1513793 RepID=A0A1Y6CH34_9BACT|nr:hypothetical protein [Pseudobacteriovorax antillogorgiicola]TCS48710.1 hypothetical protein EDD56_117132 [Pseudobacteriovorax antillogorgiicola]SMF54624.1 hypothetical protein SAMN06296036_11727 [Pseudobacteriovorax antillogorgiicola]
MSRAIPYLIGLCICLSTVVGGQILPNSPLAYKTMMKAKKTNMCYVIKSKVESGEIQDTLIFNFKDFIYHFQTDDQELVTVELTKILKNYADCNGRGGLRIDFKVKDKQFRDEKYCVHPSKEIGKDDIYTCFFIEKKALAKSKANQASKSCYRIEFFKKARASLDKVTSLKRSDLKILERKDVCL